MQLISEHLIFYRNSGISIFSVSGANGSIPNVDGARIAKHNMNASKCLETNFFTHSRTSVIKKIFKEISTACIKNREIETVFAASSALLLINDTIALFFPCLVLAQNSGTYYFQVNTMLYEFIITVKSNWEVYNKSAPFFVEIIKMRHFCYVIIRKYVRLKYIGDKRAKDVLIFKIYFVLI